MGHLGNLFHATLHGLIPSQHLLRLGFTWWCIYIYTLYFCSVTNTWSHSWLALSHWFGSVAHIHVRVLYMHAVRLVCYLVVWLETTRQNPCKNTFVCDMFAYMGSTRNFLTIVLRCYISDASNLVRYTLWKDTFGIYIVLTCNYSDNIAIVWCLFLSLWTNQHTT